MKTDRSLVGWLAAPAVFYLTIVYALPLTWLLARSMMGPEGFSLLLFREFFADPFSWRVIGNTLRIAGLVTILCLLIGYPVAFALARARGVVQVILLAAIILPLSIGVVVKAFAWCGFAIPCGDWCLVRTPATTFHRNRPGRWCRKCISSLHDSTDLFSGEAD